METAQHIQSAFGADGQPRIRFVPMASTNRGKPRDHSYIEIYAYDIERRAVVRRRFGKFGGFQTALEKQLFAEQYLIPRLRRLLLQGFVFGTTPADPEDTHPGKIGAADSLVETLYASYASAKKNNALSDASLRAYKTALRTIDQIAAAKPHLKDWPFTDLSNVHIRELVSEVRANRSASAFNNFYRAFSAMVGRARELGADFPFVVKGRLEKVKKRRNTVLRNQDRERLEAAIDRAHPELRLVVALLQFAFIRPGRELMELRVRDVYLSEGEITLAASNTKNGNRATVLLTDQMQAVLHPLNLPALPADWYLVGRNGLPGPTRYSLNHWSHLHRDCVHVACLDDTQYNLYSWRSTGAYRAITEFGHSILWLMRQMRHSNLEITSKYLSSIGLAHLRDATQKALAALPTAAPKVATNTPNTASKSVTLIRLSQMLTDGLITRTEFETLKNDLLC